MHTSTLKTTNRPGLGALATPKHLPFIRAAFAMTQGRSSGEGVDAVLKRLGDEIAEIIVTKADATVATTTVSGWADALAVESYHSYLSDIAPYSAAGKIITSSLKAELGGSILGNYPIRSGAIAAAGFVTEGGAVAIRDNAFSNVEIGPRRKLASIITWTQELGRRSNALSVFSSMLASELSAGLDAAFLSADVGSASVHQGLLYGLTATVASTSSAKSDLAALASSVAASGSSDVLFFAAPDLVARLRVLEPQLADAISITPTAALSSGRVVALDPKAIITAVDKSPDLQVSKEGSIHMANPASELVSAAGTVSDPSRSLFQSDSVALRITTNLAFAKTRSTAVAYIDGASWL